MFSTASDRFVYYVPFISKAQILDDRSISVARMIDSGTFERTSTYHVDFDRDAALAMGIAPDHVELANQMTNFTNDMLEYIETDDGLRQAFDFYTYAARYPQMIDYFTWIESNTKAFNVSSTNVPASPDLFGWTACGIWWNPKPASAAPWNTVTSSNPTTDLLQAGFHATPDVAGGGFTRAQTWNPLLCGGWTYRDHAYVLDSTHYRIQSYAGWEPNGEPNPEVWEALTWPYELWPVYVAWWHRNF